MELMDRRFGGKLVTWSKDEKSKIEVQGRDPFPATEHKDPSAMRTFSLPEGGK